MRFHTSIQRSHPHPYIISSRSIRGERWVEEGRRSTDLLIHRTQPLLPLSFSLLAPSTSTLSFGVVCCPLLFSLRDQSPSTTSSSSFIVIWRHSCWNVSTFHSTIISFKMQSSWLRGCRLRPLQRITCMYSLLVITGIILLSSTPS